MKKRVLAVILASMMALSLAGCGTTMSNEYITIKKYKGLEIDKVEKTEVTDETVESTIESYLKSYPLRTEVKGRAAQEGDTVDLDYIGKVDGKAFDGGTATDTLLKLGSNTYISANGDYKGFEEQIVGHQAGDKFDIEVKFPDEYSSQDLAGKVATFSITLNTIYTTDDNTELSDEWVKQNSDTSKTVEEFKEELKTNMQTSNEKSYQNELRTEILEALDDEVEVKKYSNDEVDEEYDSIKDYYISYAQQYGMEFEDFLKNYMNVSQKEFKKQATEMAENNVKRRMACELIAKKKNLELSDKEYKRKLKEYAEDAGYDDTDEFEKAYGEDTLRTNMIQEAVADYLLESCVQVEEEDEDTDSDKTDDTSEDTTDSSKDSSEADSNTSKDDSSEEDSNASKEDSSEEDSNASKEDSSEEDSKDSSKDNSKDDTKDSSKDTTKNSEKK